MINTSRECARRSALFTPSGVYVLTVMRNQILPFQKPSGDDLMLVTIAKDVIFPNARLTISEAMSRLRRNHRSEGVKNEADRKRLSVSAWDYFAIHH